MPRRYLCVIALLGGVTTEDEVKAELKRLQDVPTAELLERCDRRM